MSNNEFKIDSNFHTHTYLCKHATGKPIDYVKKALELGYKRIAITDHGPLIDEIISNFYTRRMNFKEFYKNYLPDLKEAKEVYQDKIEIFTALEIEYFPMMEPQYQMMLARLDFLLLGQHYVYCNGRYHSVYNRLKDEEILAYAETLVRAMETGLFKIIAHPDIYCFTRSWDEVCAKAARIIIAKAKECNVILELNANGIRNSLSKNMCYCTINGELSYGYPRREFFEIVKEYDLPVMINDDCHSIKDLHDQHTISAYQIASELGLKIINHL